VVKNSAPSGVLVTAEEPDTTWMLRWRVRTVLRLDVAVTVTVCGPGFRNTWVTRAPTADPPSPNDQT
jgi:hypothetical protein